MMRVMNPANFVSVILVGAVLGLPHFGSARAAQPSFHQQVVDDQIQIGYGLAIGRVDSDAYVDLLLADAAEIVWYQNPGSQAGKWIKHVIARHLTPRDNVCLAARDLDGDGLIELAVGANWNPGETTNTEASGALFYLKRPTDPRQPWQPVALTPHDPTTHRMRWLKTPDGFRLVVLPLHGISNRDGMGQDVAVGVYNVSDQGATWSRLKTSMHMTHNFDVIREDGVELMVVAGKEGLIHLFTDGKRSRRVDNSKAAGEVRSYPGHGPSAFVAIEPMHGSDVVLYRPTDSASWDRIVLDTTLNQGHALGVGDFLATGEPQVVAGWRGRDQYGKVGIKLYVPEAGTWQTHLIDDNQTATEDLKVVDLDADGKLDIVAAGRATKNVVIYWNRSG